MIDIGCKIKELRLDNNLLQKDLAKILGIARNTLTQYENNSAKPSYEVLIKISKHFNISTDYLLGLENEFGSNNSYEFKHEGNLFVSNGKTKIKYNKR